MSEILVRGLDENIVKRLKEQAKRHGRSLQSEAKQILESAVQYNADEVREMLKRWQTHWGDRTFSNSADLIREDRDR